MKRLRKTSVASFIIRDKDHYVLTVEGSLLTLRQQIREQENSLTALLGTTPRSIERSSLAEQSFPDTVSTGIPLRMLDNRPDVHQAEYDLQRTFYAQTRRAPPSIRK